jgi:hypothetical protein
MEPSRCWEAATCASTEELPNILWNPKFHCHVYKNLPLVSILDHVIPVHSTLFYSVIFILILSSHLSIGPSSSLFPSDLPTRNLFAFLLSLMCATCPAHLILLYLIVLMIFLEKYKLWSSLLYSFLQPPISSSAFGPNILLSTLF